MGVKVVFMPNTFDEIKKLAVRALELDQQSEEARQSRDKELSGKIYEELLMELFPKAEALLALNNGHSAFAHYTLGLVLRILQLHEEAVPHFQKSLAIAPNLLYTLLEITLCLGKSGNLVAAEEYARKAVAVSPNSAAAWGNLAMVLVQNNNRDEGFDAISRAVELDPQDPKNRYILENFHRYFD